MKWSGDVVIIGAGIAGLSIASFLGKYKLKICLIDEKSDFSNVTFYTLGSFVDLGKFGVSKNVIASIQTEVCLHSAHINLRRSDKKFTGYIINKKNLYKEILDNAIKNGIETYPSTRIEDVILDDDGTVMSVVDDNGNEYSAKIFIDASGLAGVLSKRFDLQDKNPHIATGLEYNVEYLGPQYQTHLFIGKLYQGGYGWIFPFGENRAILGYGSFNPSVRSELKKRLDAMLETDIIKKLVKKDIEELNGGTIPITDVKTKFVYKNVVCIGDSVSQVNPIVGEGHRFIMEASLFAIPYINDAVITNNYEGLHRYEDDWSKVFYKDYVWSKKMQVLADRASKKDILSDILTLFLAMKRTSTFMHLLAGHVTLKEILLP